MMKSIGFVFVAGLVLAVNGVANAALINGDFEAPLSPGWVVGATVVIDEANLDAGFTTDHAVLSDKDTTLNGIANAAGLSTTGFPQIEALLAPQVVELDGGTMFGSFLTQTFTNASAGQTLSFQYNFLTNFAPGDMNQSFAFWSFDGPGIADSVKGEGDSNLAVDNTSSPGDGGFLAGSRQTLMDGTGTGFTFQSGVQTVVFTLPPATVGPGIILTFGIVDTSGNQIEESQLLIDFIVVGDPPVIAGVPEPSSLALLGIAVACGLIYRKRVA